MERTARRIHLDFHTAPQMKGVGSRFDKSDFQRKLLLGHVDSITLFAKCHHGYTYYPSKVGKMHPNLQFDLLGAQIEACREIGVKTPIYIPVGWSNVDVAEHPDWLQYDFETKQVKNNHFDKDAMPDEAIPESCWINLCPTGEYLDYLVRLTSEVCERYAPVDGLFYDICFFDNACVCPHCVNGMKQLGLDPNNRADAEKYFMQTRLTMMHRLIDTVRSFEKDASIFFNGCCVGFKDEYLSLQTHFEVEELPTCGGEYDRIHLVVKRLEKFGKEIVGMTGKFQEGWGEFGGFKNPDALKMECATCLSLGAGISVGDQMHPLGVLDETTYHHIKSAYSYVEKLEKYCLGTISAGDIAVILSGDQTADNGVNSVLLENQIDYDVTDAKDDLSKYRCIILPDKVDVTESLAKKLKEYLSDGGKLILSGSSVRGTDFGIDYLGKTSFDVNYIKPKFDFEIKSPLLVYKGAHRVCSSLKAAALLEEPYFNRTYAHYCSHKNTPNCGVTADYPAMLEGDNLIYFAHDIFSEYAEHGAYFTKKYIEYALEKLCGKRALKVDGLGSIGRARIRKNPEKNAYCLHLFYTPVIRRGKIYVIEDLPVINGIRVQFTADRSIKKIKTYPLEREIPFECEGDTVSFCFDGLKGHQMIVLEYENEDHA